jgi:Uma2 family endonuclease
VSPNDLAEEINARINDYLGAGVKLLCVIYPDTQTVDIYRQDGTGGRLKADQELSGEDVVPGFRCPVADLFQGVHTSHGTNGSTTS